ncbi:hypothetical protein GCM10020220_109290 [Nonomuraea rubra]|uniref:cytochrome P450 n=1 Tax=Nonomuraea rubra TaxID=46180 RepID=UPI0031EC500C
MRRPVPSSPTPRFSSDKRKDGFPLFTLDAATLQQLRSQPPLMLGMDGAEHSATRRPVISEFTVKRLAALRPRVQDIVDHFIDDLLATDRHPVDLVQAFSLPVPSLVICELLGVPYTDHDFFQSRTTMMVSRTSVEDRRRAFAELRAYIGDLLTRKESEPGDDLFSRQIAGQRQKGTLDHAGLVSLAFLLLTAGHETTANMISLGVVGLLTHPEQLALITADPGKTPLAVEELLRYFTIADGVTSRIATEDVKIGGASIRAGEGVVVSGLSANWDPAVFKDPAALDVERGARHHLASASAPTSASARTWLEWNCRSSSTRCSAAFPPCGSPYRWRTFRSRTTPSSTAPTNSPSPGEHDMMRRSLWWSGRREQTQGVAAGRCHRHARESSVADE